uniref:Heat shock 70 kDa protein 14 n=1 Tax=Salarias fasciatus TaxID=181472 RepID=A0A672H5N9_SALFA
MAAIGVHFGYTCACVAIFKDGRADVVANDAGDRVTPAVVGYRDTEQIVGIAAKQGQVRNAANTVVKVKQVLGRSFSDPETQSHSARTKCRVSLDEKPYYEITAGEQTQLIAPEDVAKLIFYKMKETAQSALGADVRDAVITVPFEFAQAQKQALRDAAEAAGFHVLRLIHEPAAALLSYNIGQESSSGKRTFKHDVSSNARAMLKLMNGADMAKHSLSSLGSANCFVDSLHDGIDFDCNVSRARFELLCSALFNRSISPIRALVEQSGLSPSSINTVVLCGGSARIPRLQQMIREMFPDVDLLTSAPPDEVIAVGAALQAGLLVGREGLGPEDESVTVDVSPADILVKEVDESGAELFTVLLPSGTPLPARRHHVLSGPGHSSSLCLEIYQRFVSEHPEKLSKVKMAHTASDFTLMFIRSLTQTQLWFKLRLSALTALFQTVFNGNYSQDSG